MEIGNKGIIKVLEDGNGYLEIEIEVLAIKNVYGHERVLVRAFEGGASKWINSDKVIRYE